MDLSHKVPRLCVGEIKQSERSRLIDSNILLHIHVYGTICTEKKPSRHAYQWILIMDLIILLLSDSRASATDDDDNVLHVSMSQCDSYFHT